MNLAAIFTRRVRGFRVIEIVALGMLALTVLTVYLAKTMAAGERTQIAAVERSITEEKARLRLLHAEVAYLERPRRVSRLAETYLALEPVAAAREATVERLDEVAKAPVAPPSAPKAPAT